MPNPSRAGGSNPANPQIANRQILIVCDDEPITNELRRIFNAANYNSERTISVGAACQHVSTGRFQVVFTAASLPDGSWRKLYEFARTQNLAVCFVVVAPRSFDFQDWGDSLNCGAFDVLDSVHEIPRAADVAGEAFSFVSANSVLSTRETSLPSRQRACGLCA